MTCIYKGTVIDADLSQKSKCGTTMMKERLIKAVPSLLDDYAIHFSMPKEIYADVKNIFYAHNPVLNPENEALLNDGWKKFTKFVFVSYWQRDQYIMAYEIPYSKCTVIENAIETEFEYIPRPIENTIRFIYHAGPHKGLELLYPIFNSLSSEFDNIHLDVFSSFELYGLKEKDTHYQKLFDALDKHPKITNHGIKDNQEIITALNNSHIFLYPCIWPEASSISLIEAIRCGCLAIHPSLGALPETACNATVMYDFDEDKVEHANIAYNLVRNVLLIENKNPGFINAFGSDTVRELKHNSVSAYKTKWTALLSQLNKVQNG